MDYSKKIRSYEKNVPGKAVRAMAQTLKGVTFTYYIELLEARDVFKIENARYVPNRESRYFVPLTLAS